MSVGQNLLFSKDEVTGKIYFKYRNLVSIIITVLVLIAVPISALLIKNKLSSGRADASSLNVYEAESATLNGPVTTGSDPTASGGKFIQFGK